MTFSPSTSSFTRRCLTLFGLLWSLAACSPPPEESVSTLRLALVKDSTLFKMVQVFQINIVKAATTDSQKVFCTDFPGQMNIDDARLIHVPGSPINITWDGSSNEVTRENIIVPGNETLLILAKGLAKYVQDVHILGRGCRDDQVFLPDTQEELEIDVTATTGGACNTEADCEPTLSCLNEGENFLGGYCAKVGCKGPGDCPPGSQCVSDDTRDGVCLRRCEVQQDCTTAGNQAVQECVGRIGPSATGCSQVCVWPIWNDINMCEP